MKAYKRLRTSAATIAHRVRYVGMHHYCPLCKRSLRTFIAGRSVLGQKVVDKYTIIAMGARPHYRCPWCNSSDKERLVFSYLERKTDLFSNTQSKTVLHIAPEKNTMCILKTLSSIQYIAGDKFEGDARYTDGRYGDAVALDVTELSFDDATVDVVVCNHVLEHVPDDIQAMSELYRVLRPGGYAILQVPVSRIISQTVEDSALTTREDRLAAFGQGDHVRIYAESDYINRLASVGFMVSAVQSTDFLSPTEISRRGINPDEYVFVCAKNLSV